MLQNIEDPRSNVIKNIKKFLTDTKDNFEIYYKNLEYIIDIHINKDEKSELIKNLQMQFNYIFGPISFLLFDYFNFNEILSIDTVELDKGTYGKRLDFINAIKIKYGFYINEAITSTQMPFIINTVEFSIGMNESLHYLKIKRADGMSLEGMYKPETLMNIVTGMLGAIEMSMKQGIYNLNDQTLNNYVKQSSQFKDYLEELIKSKKEEESNAK